jgi:AcrR family transcriptional regulator
MSPDAAVADRRPGRPRSEEADRAIEAAALDLLVEEGFGGLSMEGVAYRAGVGKATVYRRWPTKEQLVLDAVTHRCAEHIVSPDTGTLRGDLEELFRALLVKFRRDGEILRAFSLARARSAELDTAFRETFLDDRRAAMREVLARGVARGELAPDDDLELLADLGSALLWHRFTISGLPLTDDLPARLAKLVCG